MSSIKLSPKRFSSVARLLAISGMALILSACQTLDRLDRVGQAPTLSPIENPKASPNYRPVSLPMPAPKTTESGPNSLWRVGSRSFFKDQRASEVGDILTVNISIDDSASLNNTSTRDRNNTENLDVPGIFGLEDELTKVLPEGATPSGLLDLERSNKVEGNGTITRDESVNLKVAAVVSQVLPNGNLVIHGRQEVRVNHEVRDLMVSGVIRPEDISATNDIEFEEIAEARISYGGRGFVSDVQNVPYGQELLDVVMPF